jgi:hypothetical protein
VRVMWCSQSFFSAGTVAALENSDPRNRRRELTATTPRSGFERI